MLKEMRAVAGFLRDVSYAARTVPVLAKAIQAAKKQWDEASPRIVGAAPKEEEESKDMLPEALKRMGFMNSEIAYAQACLRGDGLGAGQADLPTRLKAALKVLHEKKAKQ